MQKVTEPTKSGIKFIRPGELKTGDSISGRYEGQMAPDKYKKENFKIRASDGSLQVLNETSQLTRLFSQVEIGNEVKVVYQGEIETKNGHTLHTFEVYQEAAQSAPKKSALPF